MPGRRRIDKPAVVAGLLSTLLLGCSGSGQAELPTAAPVASVSTMRPAGPTHPPDDVTALVLAATGGATPAGSDLDRQWAAVFEALDIEGEQGYEPPAAVLGYRAGDLPDTACTRAGSPDRWQNNAVYCPADQRIAYDADWFRAIADDVGIEAVLAVLAHEWGHHVQSLLGLETYDLREELQADCYAGMYLVASGLVPHESLESEDAALVAAMTTFFALGNTTYESSEWFAAQEHGSPVQRSLATSTGLQSHQQIDRRVPGGMAKGLPSCFGYAEYEIGDVARIGPYTFVEPPGRPSSEIDGTYVLEPQAATGQDGSIVLMRWLPSLPHPGGATLQNLQAIWDTPQWAGIVTFPTDDPSIQASIHGGTGVAVAYIYQAKDGSNPQTGEFGLVSPADGKGGLFVLVFQQRVVPTEAGALAILEEALVTIHQVMSRLCTPDESGNPSAPNLDPVCMAVQ